MNELSAKGEKFGRDRTKEDEMRRYIYVRATRNLSDLHQICGRIALCDLKRGKEVRLKRASGCVCAASCQEPGMPSNVNVPRMEELHCVSGPGVGCNIRYAY